jgi:hypothetical protein
VVEEATRKGKVSGSNATGREVRDFTRKKARLAIKIFFFLFLKTDFLFSRKRFLQVVDITEPSVEMHFHRRFLVTACRNVPFLLASSAGSAEKRQ